MHQSDSTANLINVVRSIVLAIGFALFVTLSIMLAIYTSRQHMSPASSSQQPELQVISQLSQ
jgi:hypothetical protein